MHAQTRLVAGKRGDRKRIRDREMEKNAAFRTEVKGLMVRQGGRKEEDRRRGWARF
jgi:hypothetical protein